MATSTNIRFLGRAAVDGPDNRAPTGSQATLAGVDGQGMEEMVEPLTVEVGVGGDEGDAAMDGSLDHGQRKIGHEGFEGRGGCQ